MQHAQYMEKLKINIFVILSLMLSWAGLAPRNTLVSESIKNAGVTLEYILVIIAIVLIVFFNELYLIMRIYWQLLAWLYFGFCG